MSLVLRPSPNAPYAIRRPSGANRGVHGRLAAISRTTWPLRSTTTSDNSPAAPGVPVLAALVVAGAPLAFVSWRIALSVARHRSTVAERARLHPVTVPSMMAAAATYTTTRAETVRVGCAGAVAGTGGGGGVAAELTRCSSIAGRSRNSPGVRSCTASSDDTSLRSATSLPHEWATTSSRWPGVQTRARCRISSTARQRSGVMVGDTGALIARAPGATTCARLPIHAQPSRARRRALRRLLAC